MVKSKKYIKYQKYIHLGQYTFIHCSLKFTQRATMTQTESKQEVTQK